MNDFRSRSPTVILTRGSRCWIESPTAGALWKIAVSDRVSNSLPLPAASPPTPSTLARSELKISNTSETHSYHLSRAALRFRSRKNLHRDTTYPLLSRDTRVGSTH